MTRNPRGPLVVTRGNWMHIRLTRVHHPSFPEISGEGRSVAEATVHLAGLLARCLDHTQGPRRAALKQALAEVRATNAGNSVGIGAGTSRAGRVAVPSA